MEPATIRQQLTESRYDFSNADYVTVSDFEELDADSGEKKGKFVRTLYMGRLPERTGPLWLAPLLRLNCEWRMNIFAHKLDKELFRKRLQRKQAQATANTYQGILGPRSAPNQEEAEKAQEAAQIGSELYTTNIEVFNYAIYFTVNADSLEDLNRCTEMVRTAAPQCQVRRRLPRAKGALRRQPAGAGAGCDAARQGSAHADRAKFLPVRARQTRLALGRLDWFFQGDSRASLPQSIR
jgi:hypothetical protein